MEYHTLEKLAQIKAAGFILKPNAPEIKPLEYRGRVNVIVPMPLHQSKTTLK